MSQVLREGAQEKLPRTLQCGEGKFGSRGSVCVVWECVRVGEGPPAPPPLLLLRLLGFCEINIQDAVVRPEHLVGRSHSRVGYTGVQEQTNLFTMYSDTQLHVVWETREFHK